MKNDPHTAILDTYFWPFVDRGDALKFTPLFIGTHKGEPLSRIIAREFGLTMEAADVALDTARKEVTL